MGCKMDKFPWGRVIQTFRYEIDGLPLEIVEYHPWVYYGVYDRSLKKADETCKKYSCAEISRSSESMMVLILHWMVYKQLGDNQDSLVAGLARILRLKVD